MVTHEDQITDVESYPNFFCVGFLPADHDGLGVQFEISERVNHSQQLFKHLIEFHKSGARMIGFNNMGYDWPMFHAFLNGAQTAWELYQVTQRIIKSDRFDSIIWNPMIPQIDLHMLNHFDNRAKATSLKTIEFVMRSRSIEDLPFPPGTILTPEQMNIVLKYNGHDITETKGFAKLNREAIKFREQIGPHALNWNDTKIGTKHFIRKLEEAGIPCFNADRSPRQTLHPQGVVLADVIFPWITFQRPELRELHQDLLSQRVTQTKGGYKRTVDLDGFKFDIGMGGIHGSVHRQVITGQNTLDIDVTGYYPSLSIRHRFFPAHLGEEFCDIYGGVKESRKQYAKGTPLNTTVKLSMNAVFGNSNNHYSSFFDTAYMLKTTINGQLLQCMIAEAFLALPGVRLIQMNTDGLTIQYPDAVRFDIEQILDWWESVTGMELEPVLYRRMFIRDVNNYIAEGVDGKVKRKGAYEYKKQFWQNHSGLVIPRAVEAYLLEDIDYEDFLHAHDDPFDFLMLAKAPRGSRLELGNGQPLQKHTRYYISTDGERLVKVMPPLAGKTGERRIGIHTEGQGTILGERKNYQCSVCGERFTKKSDAEAHNAELHSWKITPCNVFDGDLTGIDYRYYIKEVEKLLI